MGLLWRNAAASEREDLRNVTSLPQDIGDYRGLGFADASNSVDEGERPESSESY
jgi:hypothetical protein